MNIVVSRLEKYPAEEPTGWAVGFTVTANNERSFYTDCVVDFESAEDDESAVNVALELLKDNINSRVEAIESKPSLLGVDVTDKL